MNDAENDSRNRPWIALFSGGKDSSWALHRACASGRIIYRLVTARPQGDSYLFHTPALALVPLLADQTGIPLESFDIESVNTDDVGDSTAHGDREGTILSGVVGTLDRAVPTGLGGIVSGAVASQFQRDRIDTICAEYGLDHYAPLWNCDPEQTLCDMLDAGFDIRIVAVAAAGLDQSWLGRRLDRAALSELIELRERHGMHLMGEGGEYETIVVAGPHLANPIRYEAVDRWDGQRGHQEITNAWVETTDDDFP